MATRADLRVGPGGHFRVVAPSERDVAVGATDGAAGADGFGDGRRHDAAGASRLDDLVDHAYLDGLLHPAGDPFVLGRELSLHRGPQVGGDLGKAPTVEHPDGGDRTHHGHLGARPGEHLGSAQ